MHSALHPARLRPLIAGATALLLAGGLSAFAAPANAATPTPAPTATPVARTFHIACKSGAARGDGSEKSPWTSVSFVHRHGAFVPGDKILLKRGTTCSGRILPTGSGRSGAPITIGAYGKGALPVVAGGGTADSSGVVQLDNLSWWTVQNLHLTNTSGIKLPKQKRAGVLVRNSTNGRLDGITIERLLIEKVDSSLSAYDNTRQFGGIAVQTGGTTGWFNGTTIRNNVIKSVGRTGIAVFNSTTKKVRDRDLRISGNRVEWARGDSIVISGVNRGRMDYNVSAHGSNMGVCKQSVCGKMGGVSTSSAGIWPIQSNDIRIDHNEVYGEHVEAGDGAGIDVDLNARSIVVEQNYVHDNAGGGVMFCGAKDTIVRNNVLQYNAKSALSFTCGWKKSERVSNITITNNSIATGGSRHPAYYVVRNIHPQNPGTGIRFTNNVVYCSGACAYTWPAKPTAASNTFVGSRSATEPRGSGNVHGGNPLRSAGSGKTGLKSLGGYHLRGKPAYGVKISGTGVKDVFGRDVNEKRPVRGAAVK